MGRVGDGDDAIHEDAGRDDRLGVQLARLNDLGDLDDRDLAIAITGPKFRAVLL